MKGVSGEGRAAAGILAALVIALLFVGVLVAGIVVVNSQSRQSNAVEKKVQGNPEAVGIFIYNGTDSGRPNEAGKVWIALVNQGGSKVKLDSLVIVHSHGEAELRNIWTALKPGLTVIVEPETLDGGLPSTYSAFKDIVYELRLHSDSGGVYSSTYEKPDEYMLENRVLVENLDHPSKAKKWVEGYWETGHVWVDPHWVEMEDESLCNP